MEKACFSIFLSLSLLAFLATPPIAMSHDCGGCKHTHPTDDYSSCEKHGAKCSVDGASGTCKQYTHKCVCEKDKSPAEIRAMTEGATPTVETKFDGVPLVVDAEKSRGLKCVYYCKAKSSLTGELTLCGWGKSDSCYQAELGAREGCRRTYWKPPYTCGQW